MNHRESTTIKMVNENNAIKSLSAIMRSKRVIQHHGESTQQGGRENDGIMSTTRSPLNLHKGNQCRVGGGWGVSASHTAQQCLGLN